jgi:hypothetical protein
MVFQLVLALIAGLVTGMLIAWWRRTNTGGDT